MATAAELSGPGYDEPVDNIMSMDMCVRLPNPEDVLFDLTCGTCCEDSAPPNITCPDGHVTCGACYLKGKGACGTEIYDENGEEVSCGSVLYGIDEAIRNTQYYKKFMEMCRFDCGLKEYGCDAVLSGNEVVKHELEECTLRFIKYCGFESVGCSSVFHSLNENLRHLIIAHNLPVQRYEQGYFTVKYGREEHFNKSNKYIGGTPVIRAAVGADDDKCMILLMVEELNEEETRLWFVKVFDEDQKSRLKVKLCIHFPVNSKELFEDMMKESLQIELEVVPGMKVMNEILKAPQNGHTYYVDLKNKELDRKYSKKEVDGKYFGLMLAMVEVRKGNRKITLPKILLGHEYIQENVDKIQQCQEELNALSAVTPTTDPDDLFAIDAESERKDRQRELVREINSAKYGIQLYASEVLGVFVEYDDDD